MRLSAARFPESITIRTPGQYLRDCRQATGWTERQIAERLCALPQAHVVTPALVVQLAWRLHQAEDDQASLTHWQAGLVERVLPGFNGETYHRLWLEHLMVASMAGRRSAMDRYAARMAEDLRIAFERMFEAFARQTATGRTSAAAQPSTARPSARAR